MQNMNSDEKTKFLLQTLHNANNENLSLPDYCRMHSIPYNILKYPHRRMLCPTSNAEKYNKFYHLYLNFKESNLSRDEFRKQNKIAYSTFIVFVHHFNTLTQTYQYIKENNLNVAFEPHVESTLNELLKREKDQDGSSDETLKVSKNTLDTSKQIAFTEVKKVQDETPSLHQTNLNAIESIPENTKEIQNNIEITGTHGIKISIPTSVSSDIIVNIIQFLRSI